jgi:DNA uptake protein ComE-like DNA-binding protein
MADDTVSRQDVVEWQRDGNRFRGAYPKKYYQVEGRKAELFPFDPNTADSTQLLRLGLQPWQVRNIYKYRAKGGVYLQPSDFARLYGLTVKQYHELEPYIHISAEYQPSATLVGERPQYERDTLKYPIKLKEGETVTLNIADTSTLKKVPGIGSAFARAIIGYGKRLGGYVSTSQLLEISNFPRKSLPYFKVDSTKIRKIKVNKLTLDQLKRHPYINFYQARTITDYRRLKGDLKSLDDLKLHKDFPEAERKRLEPYMDYN